MIGGREQIINVTNVTAPIQVFQQDSRTSP